jgi:putative FmdB family regulatory protein
MPIYEYRCNACGKEFEKLVRRSTETKDVECPACGQRKAEKAVSLFGAISGASSSGSSQAGTSCGPST